jgi:hypothetical protein
MLTAVLGKTLNCPGPDVSRLAVGRPCRGCPASGSASRPEGRAYSSERRTIISAVRLRRIHEVCGLGTGGMDMDGAMLLAFAGLSIFSGIIVGLATRSIVRGTFTSLMFLGFAMTVFLTELGVNDIFSFFLGQLLVVGSTYIFLRMVRPEMLARIKKEYTYNGPSHGC